MGEVVQSVVSQAGGGGDIINFAVMMVAMFAILYFMLIRPQRKQQAEHQALLSGLKKGDEVILSGGLFGKVFAVDEQTVIIEIADRTRVKVLKSAVSTLAKNVGSNSGTSKKAISAGSESSSTAVPSGSEEEEKADKKKSKK